ncbi:MAG: hypothetical protein IJ348_01720 [Alistipes sp.]|nr:hypothetical protein [Alistipes sp.]
MKKFFSFLLSAAILFTAASCSQPDFEDDVVPVGQEVEVTFSADLAELGSRAGEGNLVDVVYFAAYHAGTNTLLGISQVEEGVEVVNGKATISTTLVVGKAYDFVFWAENEAANHYDINWAERSLSVNYGIDANDESRDAFLLIKNNYVVTADNLTNTFYLSRPFAQLNLGSSDADEKGMEASGIKITSSSLTTKAYNTLSLTDASVSGLVDVTFTDAELLDEALDAEGEKNGYLYLSMNYLLINEKEFVDVDVKFNQGAYTRKYTTIPVQRNYRTNILGTIITDPAKFDVELVPGFATDTEYFVVTDFTALKGAAQYENAHITLANDIHLTQGLRFTKSVTLVGNGHKLTGMPAYFTGKDVVIEDVVFENGQTANNNGSSIYVEGDVNKTSVIKNCVFKGFQWEAIQHCSRKATSVEISGCTFDSDVEVHRFLHVQPTIDGVLDGATLTIKDNVFTRAHFCRNSVVCVYRYPFTNIVSSSNLVCDVDQATFEASTYNDGFIWISDGVNENNTQIIASEYAYGGETVAPGIAIINGDTHILAESGLDWLADAVNGTSSRAEANSFKGKKVILDTDIDLGNKEWTPIGNSTNKFQGIFDGAGHTISNLKISGSGKSNIGLFGVTTDGEIKNLVIENADIVGRLNVGVVAGTPYTSKYTNITVKGLVKVEGMSYVGGVGGKNAYTNWTDVTVDVEPGSYVKANSIENGTAYRTYVGGVVGFNGEGGHSFVNIKSNIDVKGSTCDVGGLFGIAHYGNKFENCECSGNVEIYEAAEAADAEEIGGIAGVWNNTNGTQVTLTNCKFTGTLKTNITEGVDLSDNTLVGAAYSANNTGVLVIDGVVNTKNTTVLAEALAAGDSVVLTDSLNDAAVNTTAPYGNYYGVALNGGVLDGNGNTLDFELGELKDGKADNYGIMTSGGTIKNVNITGVFRGIMIMNPTQDIVIENVTIGDEDVCYAINTGDGDGTHSLFVTNSTIKGWSSYGTAIKNITFTNCTFAQGEYYTNVFGRLVKPYVNTVFDGCEFSNKFYIDLSQFGKDGDGNVVDDTVKLVLKNCTVNGVKLTAENWTSLIASESDCKDGQISVELKDGSYLTADNTVDYIVFE